MTGTNTLLGVLFLCIFQAIGGVRFGAGLLDLREHSPSGWSEIVWGSLLGGFPLVVEIATWARQNNILLFLIGPTVLFASIFVRAALWDALVEQFGVKAVQNAGLGILLVALGLIAIPLWVSEGEWIPGFLWTGILLLVGVGSLARGMRSFKSGDKLDVEHESAQKKK